MTKRVRAFCAFVGNFFRYVCYIPEVLIGLISLILLGGVAISEVEDIALGEAIYFAFITGLTIGYGDISPETAWGRVISTAIGMVGMIFTGITVAIATRALRDFAEGQQESET